MYSVVLQNLTRSGEKIKDKVEKQINGTKHNQKFDNFFQKIFMFVSAGSRYLCLYLPDSNIHVITCMYWIQIFILVSVRSRYLCLYMPNTDNDL